MGTLWTSDGAVVEQPAWQTSWSDMMVAGHAAYEKALASRPVLHTARFVLRMPIEQDIPAIVAIAGDWEVASRLARMPHPYSEENARFFLAEIVPAELVWSIIDRASVEMVGVIGLAPCEQADDTIELGYYVGRENWGKGIATEASAVVAAYGVGLVGQRQLRSGYFVDNPASGRVLEKLGFVRLHAAERPCLATGGAKPSIEVGYPRSPKQ